MHKKEGQLRAYLDRQLPENEIKDVENHLKTCPTCREHLNILRFRQEMSASAIANLMEPNQGVQASPYQALARFRSRVQSPPPRDSERSVRSMLKRLTSAHWRIAWVSITALIILSLFVFYPPLRTAASDFLGIFRVRKFAAIPINISALEGNPTFADVLQTALSDQVQFTGDPDSSTAVYSVHQASSLAGFHVRLPAWLPEGYAGPSTMRVQDEVSLQVTVKVDHVRAIQEALGRTDVPIPPNLDGARVDVDIPKVFTAWYSSPHGTLNLIQAPSPEIHLPPDLNLEQLGEFGLRMAGMSEGEASRLAKTIDWANTLVIPVPMRYATYREVPVAGSTGLIIGEASTDEAEGHWMLVFERDGIVYGLQGMTTPEQLITVAESMF